MNAEARTWRGKLARRAGLTCQVSTGASTWSFGRFFPRHRTVRNREEFRAPAGVRKSPRKEPAGHRRGLWGFPFSADVGDGATAFGKGRDGCGRTASPLCGRVLQVRRAAGSGSVGIDNHHGHARVLHQRLGAFDWRLDHAMPGHEVVSGFGADAVGGPRGCLHRSNTSMTIMRPPQ